MEDVLSVYTRPRDPVRPVVCLDETSKQLVAETRSPVAMRPGCPARVDYEYARNGVANLFMMFAPLEGWRHVKVTDRRTAVDYAHALKDLADVHFAQAETIVLIQDNLNTHAAASLYEAFPAAEARRLVERFEWHYTPKHGSWLTWPNPNLAFSPRNVSTYRDDATSVRGLRRRPNRGFGFRSPACSNILRTVLRPQALPPRGLSTPNRLLKN
jgi:DDE superfamily endonuclease